MTFLDRVDTFVAGLDAETYRVGGSVRDQLIGRPCKDADYMVRGVSLANLRMRLRKLRPDSTSPLKLRDGRQVGWRVNKKGLGLIEICLPRTEVSTGPGRHDFEIVVDPDLTLAQDACRRDFTFNALYLPLADRNTWELPIRQRVSDPLGRGLHDLERRLVNTTHADSFRDDPLRILRALRFVSVLGYDLGTECGAQMILHADAVDGLTQKGVSGTALDELCKLLMGADVVKALRLARNTHVLETLLPELKPMIGFEQGSRYHDLTTDEHTFKALETAAKVDAPLRVRMALLFHDAGKPESAWVGEDDRVHYYATEVWERDEARWTEDHEVVGDRLWREAAQRLNVPRALRNDVSTLILNHMVPTNKRNSGVWVRRQRVRFGDDLLSDLLMHRACDLTGKGAKVALDQLGAIQKLEMARKEAQSENVPSSVKELKVTGFDAQEVGLTGKAIGKALSGVLDEVVCQPTEQNQTREWQLSALERRA